MDVSHFIVNALYIPLRVSLAGIKGLISVQV